MLRLRVAEYFDSVVNEIDLFTETKIQSIKTQTEEDWWNKRRQEQIDEVRRIERACLDHVNTLKVEEKEIESGEWMKRVFVEYCFTVDYADLLYLAKANRYVEPREKRFLDVHLNKKRYVKLGIDSHQSLGMTIKEFEVNLRDYFLPDAPVIDISSGLDKCFCIKSARISAAYDTHQNPICFDIEDLTITECSLDFYLQSAGEEKKAVNVIKCLMARRDHINTITIDLEYIDHLDPCQDMKELAQSIELNDRVKFYKRHVYFKEFSLFGQLKEYNNPRCIIVSVKNWQFISYISLRDVRLVDLEKADLSSLHSLTSLHLNITSPDKSSSGWMFLDVCRSSLEDLYINCYERMIPLSVSGRTFSGMTNLKSLQLSGSFSVELDDQEQLFGDLHQLESMSIHSTTIPFVLSRKIFSGVVNLKSLNLLGSFSIDTDSQEELFADLTQLESLDIDSSSCTTSFPLSRKTFSTITNLREFIFGGAFSIEVKNQEELFADLIHLKKLVLHVNKEILANMWLIYSSTVEELQISFDKSPKVASSQIRFKLPQLSSLQLCFYCDRIECDLKDMMSCFSPKKLDITSSSLDIMTKGWFHRLTSVKELVLSLRCRCLINSQLFDEFKHLTKLTIYIWPLNTFDRCAFNKLVNLETISFINCNSIDPPIDKEDKSIFDGLSSLRTIEYDFNYSKSCSYVYFENLDRFILVVT